MAADGPHRLALIGAGAIASDHARAIAATPGLQLVRVADRHLERAGTLAARYGADVTSDPAGLWADDVDAAVICTSPDSHVELAVRALNEGKAVLVEKPVALDLKSVDELLATARHTGGAVLVGQTARFQPANADVIRTARSGDIGQPKLAHISWFAGHVWPQGWRSWQLNSLRSGGHLVHNGIHAIDLACALIDDRPIHVCARPLRTWASGMPTPDSFHIILAFEHGARATIELSYGLRERGLLLRRVLLAGTSGTIAVSSDDEPACRTNPPTGPAGVEHAMASQYAHFRDVLQGNASASTTPSQIRGALAAALAAQLATDSGIAIQDVDA